MNFKVLSVFAEENVKCGFWKPLFKMRYNPSYLEKITDSNYEKDLRMRLFPNNEPFVITKNL